MTKHHFHLGPKTTKEKIDYKNTKDTINTYSNRNTRIYGFIKIYSPETIPRSQNPTQN